MPCPFSPAGKTGCKLSPLIIFLFKTMAVFQQNIDMKRLLPAKHMLCHMSEIKKILAEFS